MKRDLKAKKSMFLSLDALLALTAVIMLGTAVSVYYQPQDYRLMQLHQLGRDYLSVKYKAGFDFSFLALTGYNSTAGSSPTQLGVKIIAYPKLCDFPSTPACFTVQDTVGKPLAYNAVVNP